MRTFNAQIFSSVILSILFTQQSPAAAVYRDREDFQNRFTDEVSELGDDPIDDPKDEDPKKKKFRDPLLRMILERNLHGVQSPESLKLDEKFRLRTEKWKTRDVGSPWATLAENSGVVHRLSVQPSYTQFKTSNTALNASVPTTRLIMNGWATNGSTVVGTTTHRAAVVYEGSAEIMPGSRNYANVRAGFKIGVDALWYTNPKNLTEDQGRFSVSGGLRGQVEGTYGANGTSFHTMYGAVAIGPDLQRLLMGKSSAVTVFQFQPAIGFVGGQVDASIKSYVDESRKDISILEVSSKSDLPALPSYGMIGKLFIRPGVYVDVLWLRRFNTDPAALEPNDAAATGSDLFRGSVMIRLGKKFSLNGSYDWTSFENAERASDGTLSFKSIKIQQTSIGLSFLFGEVP